MNMREHEGYFMKRFVFLAAAFMAISTVCHADVIAYPNPWIPEDTHSLRGNLADGITFAAGKGVPISGACDISIYTISGNLVSHRALGASDAKKWMGKNDNDNGKYVASGVYLWVVKTAQETKTGKIVVVR